jgi:hypothetical protein
VSGWTNLRDEILSNRLAGTRVLLLEGKADMEFIRKMLDLKAPGNWPSAWSIGNAGGKRNVQNMLHDQPDWIALVDRDEWTAEEIAAKQAEFPGRLMVLPRYCLESYFILPSEIWAALPSKQQLVPGGLPAVEAAITNHAALLRWVRHGCLWHAVNPLHSGLRALGFVLELLDVNRAQDDALIRQTLDAWHQYLDPVIIDARFQQYLTTATASPVNEQLISWVHGKEFFNQHVVQALNGLFGQASEKAWRTEMLKNLPLPPDLDFLWAAMGLT